MSETRKVSIDKLKPNPGNPRIIKDDKFKKLVKSIKEFPEMLKLRPIVVDRDMVVLGGNMRLRALSEAGVKEVDVIVAGNLTEDQKREFIIKDNVGFGEWDWDKIADEWEYQQLGEWGLDVPGFDLNSDFREDQPYEFMNKVTIEFDNIEEATAYFEKVTKEGLKAKLS